MPMIYLSERARLELEKYRLKLESDMGVPCDNSQAILKFTNPDIKQTMWQVAYSFGNREEAEALLTRISAVSSEAWKLDEFDGARPGLNGLSGIKFYEVFAWINGSKDQAEKARVLLSYMAHSIDIAHINAFVDRLSDDDIVQIVGNDANREPIKPFKPIR